MAKRKPTRASSGYRWSGKPKKPIKPGTPEFKARSKQRLARLKKGYPTSEAATRGRREGFNIDLMNSPKQPVTASGALSRKRKKKTRTT